MNRQRAGRKSKEAVRVERDAILAILSAAGESLSRQGIRDEYQRRFRKAIAYNTVKARLEELLKAGIVGESTVSSRRVRYALVKSVSPEPHGARAAHDVRRAESQPRARQGTEIPLSPEARRVQELVARPRVERAPVGYDVTFLDDYEPGVTFYLDAAERARLHGLGRTAFAGQPAGTYARDIMQRLIIDLSWGSSRLEGLRYSRIDTEELLDAGKLPSGATDRDRQLILNHKAAIEFLVEEAQSIAFNSYTIKNLHALLAENLLDNRDDEGALRRRAVGIGSSVYTPTAIPQVIEERFATVLDKAQAIPDPIEQSFFVMVHLPYLQPFIDANKRTSRLAANIPLIRANLCPLSFVDVPEPLYTEGILGVYELKDVTMLRDVFAWAYERSCAQFKVLREAMGEPDPTRLNYRSELRAIVADVVRGVSWPTDDALIEAARNLDVPSADRIAVAGEARKDLHSLRPEVLARYSIRASEFDKWARAVSNRRESRRERSS